MSKVQTRRTVSISRAAYDALKQIAADAGVSGSEWVTQRIRDAKPELPIGTHVRLNGQTVVPTEPRLVVHVPSATAEPPPRTRQIPASFCAVCTSDVGPFFAAPLGKNGALVAICSACEDEPSNSGRYNFDGGSSGGGESRLDRLNGTRRAGGHR